jgi:N-acetyl-alpha-D-glucosaminyl L-malate synthase BshA
MRIAMLCYASVGGSGVIATELAHALALRGHDVHVLSHERPFRWRTGVPGLSFVPVDMPAYPVFREPQYLLGTVNAIVRLARQRPVDIVHAHYAVPHATAAYLAREMLAHEAGPAPRTVTTLHGTDVTLIADDPCFRPVVAYSIEQSDSVTVVSASLKADTLRTLSAPRDIRVIPNFVDCGEWRRRPDRGLRESIAPSGEAVVMHASNFRPVKRLGAVIDVFVEIRRQAPATLVLVGDGPDRAAIERRVADEGMGDSVRFVGEQQDLVAWLSAADIFLLPSAQESFGLAALEAMACEVPVIASAVGGLPEVIEDGVTGFMCPPDAIGTMAQRAIDLLTDRDRLRQIGQAAAGRVRARWCTDTVVPQYEAVYADVTR